MNNKKKKIIPTFFVVFLLFSTLVLSYTCFASVIYKDISSISIKTKFNFDYDFIQNEGIPDIEIADTTDGGSSDANVYTASTKYAIESAEWYNNDIDEFSVGGEPKIICYLITKDYPESTNNDYYYRFLSSYGTSSCYIGGGSLVSAQRVSTDSLKVIFKLKNLKGTFNQPEEAFWADDYGTAQWYPSQVNDSGYYDIVLYRDSSMVAHVTRYKGNSYNFYNYMTKTGSYSYKVRTVGGDDVTSAYGKNSEYIESTSFDVNENNLYDPAKGISNYNYNNNTNTPGSTTNPSKVGWIQSGNKWYFVRPDGVMIKNGWIEWNGKWYYLGETGEMATGWLENNGYEYYLQSDGTMLTGWLCAGNSYFYFNTSGGESYGAKCKNMFVNYQNKYFYFDDSGVMVTGWRQIKDSFGNTAFYYFYPNGEVDGLFGYMATNTTINGFYIGADGKWVQSSR